MGKFLKGAFAGGIGAAVVMTATAAVAGTGIGGVFNLGQTNTVNETSSLSGTKNGPLLHIGNGGSGMSASGISVFTNAARPPLTVSSTALNARLNSDRLDSFHASELSRTAVGGVTESGSAANFLSRATVTLTAPKDGFAIVTGTAIATEGCSSCFVHTRLREPATGATSRHVIDHLQLNGTLVTSPSQVWVVPAPAGEHTYSLDIGVYPTDQGISVNNPTIVAHWVPFDGSGNPPDATPTLQAEPAPSGKPDAQGSIPAR